FPTAYSAYVCFPVEILPGSKTQLTVTLDATGDSELKRKFVDRNSPDPAGNVYSVGPWDYLGPGLSGAPILDWYSGDVIAVVDGGAKLADGRHAAWAIPLDPAILGDARWGAFDKQSLKGRLSALSFDSLPEQLTSSDRSTPPGTRPMTVAERAT